MAQERPINCPLCHNHPRLAGYGIDDRGRLFVHIMVYKANVKKADVYVHGGTVTLMCYKCNRYHTITIRQTKAHLTRARAPNLEAPPIRPPLSVDPLNPFHLE